MPPPSTEDEESANSLNDLGIRLDEMGEFQEAEAMHREALEIRQALGDPLGAACSLNNLAIALVHQDRLTDAEAAFRASLDLRKNLFAEEHPEIEASLRNLAAVIARQEKTNEPESTPHQIGDHGEQQTWDRL